MAARRIAYWVTTLLISFLMSAVAFVYLTHESKHMEAFARLGYPGYFPSLLGVAKALGVVALLAPGLKRLKEWAYAGLAFTYVAAFASHLASGEPGEAVAPVVVAAVLMVSYATRPPDRMLHG